MAAEATYCRVLPSFWSDPKVKRRLSKEQKYLLLYFFTSPHTNLIGLYYLPLTYAEAETGLAAAEIREWIEGPLTPFVSYDPETEEILVHRAARHQIGEELKERDNRTKAVERILRDTHSADLVARFRELYPDWHLNTPAPAAPPAGPSAPPEEPQPEGPPSPLGSPLPSPLVSLSSSSSSSCTGTELDMTNGLLLPAREIDEGFVSRVVMLANRGMGENPALPHYEPIPPGHGSRQDVIDWLHAGVSPDTIEAVVLDRAKQFRPEGRRRQISSMRYFTPAVLDEHDRTKASTTEVKNGNGTPNGRPKSRAAASPSRGTAIADDQSARRQYGFSAD